MDSFDISGTERQAEEERLRAEEEAKAAEIAAKKKLEEEQAEARRREREADREKAAEQAKLQARREEEAEARRLARAAENKRAASTASSAPPLRANGASAEAGGGGVWRRKATDSTPVNSTPPTPNRTSTFNQGPPPRSESPAPVAGKYRPGAFAAGGGGGGGGGGWRAREEAAKNSVSRSGAATPVRAASPAPPAPKDEGKADDDGFQTVTKKEAVWRPRRGGRP